MSKLESLFNDADLNLSQATMSEIMGSEKISYQYEQYATGAGSNSDEQTITYDDCSNMLDNCINSEMATAGDEIENDMDLFGIDPGQSIFGQAAVPVTSSSNI